MILKLTNIGRKENSKNSLYFVRCKEDSCLFVSEVQQKGKVLAMKVLQINATYRIGSTGHIMSDMNNVILENGYESFMVCAYSNEKNVANLYTMQTLPTRWEIKKNLLISRLTGRMGYRCRKETQKMLQWVAEIKPDIVHLHNIHGNYLHLESLFSYLKKNKIPVVWTLHDCWPFTGRCSHFELHGCEQWKTGCQKCTQKDIYPITYFFDFSKRMWKDKKEMFTGLANVQLVTPSAWLKQYVDQSYLNKYDCSIINNGVNLDTFYPCEKRSHYLADDSRKVILGMTSSWSERKGLYDFFKLDTMIDHEKYRIVLVGLNDRQMQQLPDSILGVRRTNNVQELVELYSSADVYVNPTYQDNYPTVNLEAAACGTPVITYRTGGSPESVPGEVGLVVEQGSIEQLYHSVMQILSEEKNAQTRSQYAKDHFDKNKKYEEYLQCYHQLMERVGD